ELRRSNAVAKVKLICYTKQQAARLVLFGKRWLFFFRQAESFCTARKKLICRHNRNAPIMACILTVQAV
ncbi:hypothetical protein, partial [Neisseria sp.]|uniref:hypothetical protein n=1 Tax=Neisseria sp. TaxID=192066 RepID=UPI002898059C